MALQWRGDVAARRTKAAALEGMQVAAEALLAHSNARVPLADGLLKASGKASSEYDADGVIGAVSYNTPYAARQHEELGYSHAVGEAKYLENAKIDFANEFKSIIAQTIRTSLGG